MASQNINKLIRNNPNLKPWILAKNSSEIVSTYIKKLYQQVPDSYKNGLLQSKFSTSKIENRGPLKTLKCQDRFCIPIMTQVRSKQKIRNASSRSMLKLPSTASKLCRENANTVNANSNRKLLKSPNFKIYSSRKFGSSVSSLNATIYRTYNEKRQNKLQQTANHELRFLYRSFGFKHSHNALACSFTKYNINPPRAEDSSALRKVRAEEVSTTIQRDLMSVDSSLKERISVKRVPKLIKDEPTIAALTENTLPIKERISVTIQRTPVKPIKEEKLQKMPIANVSAENRFKNVKASVPNSNVSKKTEEAPLKAVPEKTYSNRRFRATTKVRQRKIIECTAPEVKPKPAVNLSPMKKPSKISTTSYKKLASSQSSEKSNKSFEGSRRGYHKLNTPSASANSIRNVITARRLWKNDIQKDIITKREPVPVPVAAVFMPNPFARRKENAFTITDFIPRRF